MRIRWNKGAAKRTPAEQVAIATRVLDERHYEDVRERVSDSLGSRKNVVGPPDLSRNTLVAHVDRSGRAYILPPLVSGLTADFAGLFGDYSATTTIARYATADGYPMPTPMTQAGTDALRYRLGAGFAGTLIGVSQRSSSLYLETIAPCDLDVVYASDDPHEPTIIRHRGERMIDGAMKGTVDEYDLTDLASPVYRVLLDGEDVTSKALGESYSGEAYEWRYPDGTPYHRIVISGHPRFVYRTAALVEVTLNVAVHWTSWGAGVLDAGFPQRNVRGLALAGMDSDGDANEVGLATGAETVLTWVDVDPERPGDHWQDGPGFDPEGIARAIRTYETAALSALGMPVDHEATGGEPTATEREAMAEYIATTYPECRRHDSEVLRRCSALATRLGLAQGLPVGPFGTLYGDEVRQALSAADAKAAAAAANMTPEDDGV